MKWNQWVSVVFVAVSIYLISKFLPSPEGAAWFNYQALWSMVALFVILKISTAKLAIILALIEFSLIIVNTIAYAGYASGGGLIYTHYFDITDVLHLTEVLVLVTGAPWDGLASRFKQLGVGRTFCVQDNSRRISNLHSDH